MFTDANDVLKYIKAEDVEFVDVRFMDLPGVMQHFNVPIGSFDQAVFDDGLMFDGSSIRGFQAINESDMKLLPDPATAYLDPFRNAKTIVMNFSVHDPYTNEPYSRDPRNVASNAEAYLKSTGIADTAYFGAEAEFYVFDDVRFETKQNASYYYIDSIEGAWNTGRVEEGGNLGYKTPYKGGYFPVPPTDHFADIRDDMVRTLQQVGLQVERSHHEVGTAGQGEINYKFNTLQHAADEMMLFKYVIKNVAWQHGKSATFMPKPLFGDNGSGMHCHQSIWKDGEPLMYDEKGYGGLSDIARWYIGGLLAHAPSLLAFTNPTVNSYHRLVPGYEAPVNLVYSARNRSACIRIPRDGHLAQGEAHRVPRSGSVKQPVPRVRRSADGRHRRNQEQDRAARAGRQGPVRAAPGRARQHPAGAGLSVRGARCTRGRQRVPAGRQCLPRRPHRDVDRLQADQGGRSDSASPASPRVRAVLQHLIHEQQTGSLRVDSPRAHREAKGRFLTEPPLRPGKPLRDTSGRLLVILDDPPASACIRRYASGGRYLALLIRAQIRDCR